MDTNENSCLLVAPLRLKSVARLYMSTRPNFDRTLVRTLAPGCPLEQLIESERDSSRQQHVQAGIPPVPSVDQGHDGDQAVPEDAIAQVTDEGEQPLDPVIPQHRIPDSAQRGFDLIQLLQPGSHVDAPFGRW